MTEISIDPSRIKTIRKARKIGRPKLAKLTGVTERQLAKIETSSAASLDISALQRLSAALDVPVPTLTGEFEIAQSDLSPASAQKCTSGCCS